MIAERKSQTDGTLAQSHSSSHTTAIEARSAARLEHECIRASLTPTTHAAYRRSVNMLRRYVTSVCPGIRTFPVSRSNLAGFITHMFTANYASSTILSTVSAVSYSHKIVGLADPADNFYIKKLLVGINKSVDFRRPIDLHMLGQLLSATKAVIPNKFTQLCVAAMHTLAFHGFLRIGEITVRAGVPIEHVIHRNDRDCARARWQE